jgi:hypothetical protein
VSFASLASPASRRRIECDGRYEARRDDSAAPEGPEPTMMKSYVGGLLVIVGGLEEVAGGNFGKGEIEVDLVHIDGED